MAQDVKRCLFEGKEGIAILTQFGNIPPASQKKAKLSSNLPINVVAAPKESQKCLLAYFSAL